MKGDFSRLRFNPRKQYTAVLEQQGRVALDADANEQCAIEGYLRQTETVDVIGEYGAPAHDAGFAISVSGNDILIGSGRYYVEGLMCENAQDNLSYGHQPCLVGPSPSASALLADLRRAGGSIQVFLQVWQRLVTALDDPCLREPALGQADTTARLQTVWRVVAELVAPPPTIRPTISLAQPGLLVETSLALRRSIPASVPKTTGASASARSTLPGFASSNPATGLTEDCCAQMYDQHISASTGAMAAMTSGGSGDCSCQPLPAAGFQGLENQLYRIEIHKGGDAANATFKWSRENGSVVAAVVNISGTTVWVSTLGPDANLGFQANDWVEISDDSYLFGQAPNQPGLLYQVLKVDPTGLSLTLATPAAPVDPARNARVRRWDQSGTSAGSNGMPLSVNTWQTLENGIQVNFQPGTYHSGDYWTVPARTASGQIDWPPCGGDGNLFQSPSSVTVFKAPLACIHWDSNKRQVNVESCRRIFFPLTEITPEVTPQALHITDYSWLNDDIITFDVLLKNGLAVTLDNVPTGPVNGANFIVTLEAFHLSFLSNAFNATGTPIFIAQPAAASSPQSPPAETLAARAVAGPGVTATATAATSASGAASSAATLSPGTVAALAAAAPPPSFDRPVFQVLPLSLFALDWQLIVDQSSKKILWQLPATDLTGLQFRFLQLINELLQSLAQFGIYARVRIRLMGHTIFAQNANANTQAFLDGQSFGEPGTRQDGKTPCISLQMPSGNGAKASDFEGWFYLAPFNSVLNLTMNFTAFTVVVSINNTVIGVTAGTPPQTVTPQVTVHLRYPVVMAGGVAVDLAISAVTANVKAGNFVSLASTRIVIPQGASSGTVNINVFGNPGMGPAGPIVYTFQITATAELAFGSSDPQSVQFTLAGAPVIIP